jgi:hypothetical protein
MNKLLFTPHPNAPLFNKNPELVIDQIIQEVKNNRYSIANDEIREVFRQAGFVNLWFFLKFIAGYGGPFDLLNEDLHIDMCNFRQSQFIPGRKAACFLFRRGYKSTINTEGGTAWGLLRNPDLCVEMFSCIKERSMDFMHTTQRIFDGNELFMWLYPEYVPDYKQKRWNDVEMVLPNRTKHFTEPSLRPHGVGCSTAGIHGDLCVVDDPVGDSQLTSDRDASADMERIYNWLKSNIESGTLIKDERMSMVFYSGTRYGVQDAHRFIFKNVHSCYGYWKDIEVQTDPANEWHVYNRKIIEDGEITFPEKFSEEKMQRMERDDPWTYYTQYQNDPQKSGLNELSEYEVKECTLEYAQENGYFVRIFLNGEEKLFALSAMDVIIACDPGGSERRETSKTSKSSVVVFCRDSSNRRFVIALKDGYDLPSVVFDWAYKFVERFYDYFRRTVLEAQGPFKVLGPVWRDYLKMRNKENMENRNPVINMKINPVPKTGNKDVMIRNILEPVLKEGLLYAEKSIKKKVESAIKSFPFGTKDILDSICLAEKASVKPLSEKEFRRRERLKEQFYARNANAAGY